MIYFTADTHFGHCNVIRFCDRPFASAEEPPRVHGVGLKLFEKLRPLIQAAPGRRTADTW